LEAMEERPGEHLEALAEAGVVVGSVRLTGALHVADVGKRAEALRRMKRQVDDAARLGALVAYLFAGPVGTGAARAYFTDGSRLLANYAASRLVDLAVGGLPEALTWAEEQSRHHVGLAVEGDDDDLARRAGEKLWYVRKPGKVMEATLLTIGYLGFVAVDL